MKNFFKKLSPKRAFDAVMRRKAISALVAALVTIAAAYGLDLAPDAQKAFVDFLVALTN